MSPCLPIEFYFLLLPHTSARVGFQLFFIIKRKSRNRLNVEDELRLALANATANFVLRPFTSAYLCESGFSTLLHVKMKARNRLNVEDEMRLALANAQPRILFYVLLLPYTSARVDFQPFFMSK